MYHFLVLLVSILNPSVMTIWPEGFNQRTTLSMKQICIVCSMFLCFQIIGCDQKDDVIPEPTLYITKEFPSCVQGEVKGINPENYKIAAFAKMEEGWYNLPDTNEPLTPISKDLKWTCSYDTSSVKSVVELRIFLLPNSVNPPLLSGEAIIPYSLNLLSATNYQLQL